ncbi:putative alkaline lipase [Aspergillus fumigatus]
MDSSTFANSQRAAELSSEANTGCVASAFDVTFTKQIYNLGYIGYSMAKKSIAVVMRGSTTATDILNDVDTIQVTTTLAGVSLPSSVTIMNGVYRSWAAVTTKSSPMTLAWWSPDARRCLVSLWRRSSQLRRSEAMRSRHFQLATRHLPTLALRRTGTRIRGNNANDGVPNMYVTTPYNFAHYGIYFGHYKCSGERDPQGVESRFISSDVALYRALCRFTAEVFAGWKNEDRVHGCEEQEGVFRFDLI